MHYVHSNYIKNKKFNKLQKKLKISFWIFYTYFYLQRFQRFTLKL